MSSKEKREMLENFDKKLTELPEEQKQFVLGYMEGVCQASERHRRAEASE